MITRIFTVLFSFLLVIIQTSFLTHFPNSLAWLHLLLLAVLYAAFFLQFEWAILLAVSGGLLLDMLSIWPFGIITIILLLSLLLEFLLSLGLLTNKSLYSWLVLIVVTTLIFQGLMIAFNYGLYFSKVTDMLLNWEQIKMRLFVSLSCNTVFGLILFFLGHRWLEKKFIFAKNAST